MIFLGVIWLCQWQNISSEQKILSLEYFCITNIFTSPIFWCHQHNFVWISHLSGYTADGQSLTVNDVGDVLCWKVTNITIFFREMKMRLATSCHHTNPRSATLHFWRQTSSIDEYKRIQHMRRIQTNQPTSSNHKPSFQVDALSCSL